MSLPEPPTPWSTGLLLSLALCCGCQRSLPRVVQRQFDAATPPAASDSPPATASGQVAADAGWKATGGTQAFSANGTPLGTDATGASTGETLASAAAPMPAITAGDTATFDAQLSAPRSLTGTAMEATPSDPQFGTPPAEIRQTQYLAGATDRDMETLRQRLEQQTQVNTALTQAIVQLQRQTEAHHKSIVQLAEELNARQARQDKVTEEILSLIEQMASGSPRPAPPAAGPARAGAASSESPADGGNKK